MNGLFIGAIAVGSAALGGAGGVMYMMEHATVKSQQGIPAIQEEKFLDEMRDTISDCARHEMRSMKDTQTTFLHDLMGTLNSSLIKLKDSNRKIMTEGRDALYVMGTHSFDRIESQNKDFLDKVSNELRELERVIQSYVDQDNKYHAVFQKDNPAFEELKARIESLHGALQELKSSKTSLHNAPPAGGKGGRKA